MLFNSYPFLFVFLPAVLALFYVAARFGDRARLAVILCGSLFFYAWWDVRFLGLLALSIVANYGIGRLLTRAMDSNNNERATLVVTTGVVFNLLTLGVFKYANFFIGNVNAVAGTNFHLAAIILPLGISFFTFEQIGYLVDIRRGHRYPSDLLSFAVFVSFFPRLVAGPILRYSEIAPQLAFSERQGRAASDLSVGLTIFFFGLFKKVVLADGIAGFANAAFMDASSGKPLDLFSSWGGVLSYTLQLYFDFSGYSDMAIGAARCFGIRFPVNFDSPYKSASIIEFWRRWHITLSQFLRDYVYISLGGNRRGPARRYVNLIATMMIGGLWHGANWTFVCWGALHGAYLALNHAWVAVKQRTPLLAHMGGSAVTRVIAIAITFLAVIVAWTFFRAPNFTTALNVLAGMSGLHGAVLPDGIESMLSPYRDLLSRVGISFGDGSMTTLAKMYLWVGALLAVALLAPNTQQILARFEPVLECEPAPHDVAPRLRWSFSPVYAVATGVIAFIAVISVTRLSEFLYWQF